MARPQHPAIFCGTLTESAGPYIHYKIEPDVCFVPVQKKSWKIGPHVSNVRSRQFFFKGFRVAFFGSVLRIVLVNGQMLM